MVKITIGPSIDIGCLISVAIAPPKKQHKRKNPIFEVLGKSHNARLISSKKAKMLMYSNTPAFARDSTTGFTLKSFAIAVDATNRVAIDVNMILLVIYFTF